MGFDDWGVVAWVDGQRARGKSALEVLMAGLGQVCGGDGDGDGDGGVWE